MSYSVVFCRKDNSIQSSYRHLNGTNAVILKLIFPRDNFRFF